VRGLRINEEKLAQSTSYPFYVLGKLTYDMCVLYIKMFHHRGEFHGQCDSNFLDSKENICKELDDLSFSILPANGICKACLVLVDKRRSSKNGYCEV
jgi:hypothetical protein